MEKRGADERQEEIECKEREEGWMKGGEEGGSKEGRRIESGERESKGNREGLNLVY